MGTAGAAAEWDSRWEQVDLLVPAGEQVGLGKGRKKMNFLLPAAFHRFSFERDVFKKLRFPRNS